MASVCLLVHRLCVRNHAICHRLAVALRLLPRRPDLGFRALHAFCTGKAPRVFAAAAAALARGRATVELRALLQGIQGTVASDEWDQVCHCSIPPTYAFLRNRITSGMLKNPRCFMCTQALYDDGIAAISGTCRGCFLSMQGNAGVSSCSRLAGHCGRWAGQRRGDLLGRSLGRRRGVQQPCEGAHPQHALDPCAGRPSVLNVRW